jgi:hypothetical protein
MRNPLARFVPRCLRALVPAPGSAAVSPQAQELSNWLGVPAAELARLRLGPRYHYRPFTVTKRDGRPRRILAPTPALKRLQHRLLHNYLDTLPVHPAALGFRSGSSTVTNAGRHAGQALVITLDLADFFESTSADRVRAFFVKRGWRGELLGALMRLCVYRAGLPQGAPTSPALSNLVNYELDETLTRLAGQAGARYTRYGDDLTFSWPTENYPAYFEAAVRRAVLAAGYTVQPRKDWRVQRAGQAVVTGLVIGRAGKIHLPLRLRWQTLKLRWLFWLTRDPQIGARWQGYVGLSKTPGLD